MTTGTQVSPLAQVCQSLTKMHDKFAQALPQGMSAERFIRVVINAIQMHPQKDALLRADRASLFNSCLKAATDGLEIDGRQAALVCFKGQATYMPMVQGLVKLARNSGEISSISSEVVYENDEFEFYEDFDGSKFKHQINWRNDRGKPILVWAKVKLDNGETIIRAFTKRHIDKIASKTHNSNQYSPENGDYFEEWWRKTAIKNVLKYAPKSTYLETALENDDKAEGGEFVDIIPEVPAPQKTERKTKTSEIVTQAQKEPDYNKDTGEIIDAEYEEELPV